MQGSYGGMRSFKFSNAFEEMISSDSGDHCHALFENSRPFENQYRPLRSVQLRGTCGNWKLSLHIVDREVVEPYHFIFWALIRVFLQD